MAKYECSCVPPKLPCKKCYDKRGGQHSINNILPACAYCNDSKGSKTSAEFKANEINR